MCAALVQVVPSHLTSSASIVPTTGASCVHLACYYFSEEHEKFASRGRLGVVLGDSRLQSYNVRNFEHYVETKRERPGLCTLVMRWPFHEPGMDKPDTAHHGTLGLTFVRIGGVAANARGWW